LYVFSFSFSSKTIIKMVVTEIENWFVECQKKLKSKFLKHKNHNRLTIHGRIFDAF